MNLKVHHSSEPKFVQFIISKPELISKTKKKVDPERNNLYLNKGNKLKKKTLFKCSAKIKEIKRSFHLVNIYIEWNIK